MIVLLSFLASFWAVAFGLSCLAFERERRKTKAAEYRAKLVTIDLKGAVGQRDALLEQRTALLIQVAAKDSAFAQLAEIHRRDLTILRAALIDVHAAIVADQERPEDRLLAGMVTQ